MKKLLLLIVAMLLFIGIYSLNTDALSFDEVKRVPRDVQESVDLNHTLQQIYKKGHSYIVFQSAGIVGHELEVEGDMVKILLTAAVSNDDNDGEVKQHVYKLRMIDEYEKIAVFINGELVPFDEVVAGR